MKRPYNMKNYIAISVYFVALLYFAIQYDFPTNRDAVSNRGAGSIECESYGTEECSRKLYEMGNVYHYVYLGNGWFKGEILHESTLTRRSFSIQYDCNCNAVSVRVK